MAGGPKTCFAFSIPITNAASETSSMNGHMIRVSKIVSAVLSGDQASSYFNLGSIIAGVAIGYWLDPHFGARSLVGLAIVTLIGGAWQWIGQFPSLWKVGYKFRPDFHWRDEGVRTVLTLMGTAVIAA